MDFLKKYLFLFLVLYLSAVCLKAQAQDYSEPIDEGEIIVEQKTDLSLTYKERRETIGTLFSVGYERYNPKDYKSLILNQGFEAISGGNTIGLLTAEFGVKYNFVLGSLAGLVSYGSGNLSNSTAGLDQIKMSTIKGALNYTADNLLKEPYVAPYVQLGLHQTKWEETSTLGATTETESFTAKINYHFKAGLLLQLDWIENSIDSTTTTEGLRSSGLENTFLDLYYNYYAEPSQVANTAGADGEANLASSHFGVGLKLEF